MPVPGGGPNVSYTPAISTLVDNAPPQQLQEVAPAVGSQDYSGELSDNNLTQVNFQQLDSGANGSGIGSTTLEYNTATDGSASGQWLSADAAPATGDGDASTYWESSDVGDGLHRVRATTCDRAGNCTQTVWQASAASSRQACDDDSSRPGLKACYAGFGFGVPAFHLARDTSPPGCSQTLSGTDDASINATLTNLQPGAVLCLVGGSHYGDNQGEFTVSAHDVTIETTPGQSNASWQGRVILAADKVTLRELNLDGQNLLSSSCSWEPAGVPACPKFSPTINGNYDRLIDNDITSNAYGVSTSDTSSAAVSTHNNCIDITPYPKTGPPIRGTLVKDNTIHDCGVPIPGEEADGGHLHGVYVEQSGVASTDPATIARDSTRITNNYLYRNADRAIQLYPNGAYVIIDHNTINDNGEGIDVANSTSNATITNNIATNARAGTSDPRYTGQSQNHYIYNLYTQDASGSGNVAKNNCFWQKANQSAGVQGSNASLQVINKGPLDPSYRNPDAAKPDLRPGNQYCLRFGADPTGYFQGYGVMDRMTTPDYLPQGNGYKSYSLAVAGAIYGSVHKSVDIGANDGDPCSNRSQTRTRTWTSYVRYEPPGGNTKGVECIHALGKTKARKYSVAIRRYNGRQYQTVAAIDGHAKLIYDHRKNVYIGRRGLLVEAYGEAGGRGAVHRDVGGTWGSQTNPRNTDSVRYQQSYRGPWLAPAPDGSDWFDLTSHNFQFGYTNLPAGPSDFCIWGPAAPRPKAC